MKNKFVQRAISLLLALVCVLGALPLAAFAAGLSSAPGSITQKSSAYMTIGGRSVRYKAASSTINNVGLPYVFNEQVDVPGFGSTRALCAYQKGTLGPAANGQKWNFKEEVTHPSLVLLLSYIYSHTYGNFTDAGNAVAAEHWNQYWSDIWFMVAQAMSWYYEHGILKDVNTDREGFINQAAEEFVAAMRLYHDTYGQSSFIKDWSKIDIHSIIDSADGGKTGNSAYDYINAGVKLMQEHPEYYKKYHLWIYDWDKSQPWKLAGQSGVPMQRLLIAVPDPEQPTIDTVQLTVKKLEAGSNKPMAGVTFKIENANDPAAFSVTRETGADGTITLTKDADNLTAGQYMITEEAVPEGYVAQTASQLVTVLPNGSANSVFTFYNEPESPETPTPDTPSTGTGTIKKVDADNPTVGIPGAVIRITSVKLDDGGSFMSEYTTKDGGYILKEDLDFSKLATGSYIAEEITPPEGYILSSDVSKVKQPFVWDGEHDVSLVFENSSKVKVMLKKVDESNAPLAGAIFVILRDGQVIGTEETGADGTITVSNVSEGYYEFREVSAPAGFDCDRSPVGVHVEAEDLQGEQTITVTKMNHHKRDLTIQKRDAETGDPIPGTSFHVRGVNLGYENDVVTGADGTVTLSDMLSGCYEVEETDVPKPYILDSNNRKTVWIDAAKDQDVVVDFVNSKLPGVRLVKRDRQTNQPIPGVTFKIEEVDGGFTDQRQTDKDGMIFWENLRPGAYKVYEVEPAPNYVHDDTVHVVQLEPNHTTTIELTNILKPTLKIMKVDSVTHSPIAKVKFQIWRGSDDTITGELNDLGTFQTNDSGEIVLEHIDTGWYRIKELEPAPGYTIKQPDTQDIYLKAGETHTVPFENTPKNCIIVEKYDSVTGEALGGCTFQLRYLAGSSGTGGTVIGQKVTNKNGVAMWTGLEPGAYVVEEVDPADGYSIINSSETVYLADNGEQSVITVRFDNMPDGLLLVRKVCATNPSITLQNAEFKITYADGTYPRGRGKTPASPPRPPGAGSSISRPSSDSRTKSFGSFPTLPELFRHLNTAVQPEPQTSGGGRDPLHQTGEQSPVKFLQPLRPLADGLRRLPQGLRRLADVIVFQQPPALGPELGQLGLQGRQPGGAGIVIQQAIRAKFTDFVVLLRGLGDGPVDLQHGGVFPLYGLFQLLHLPQGRPQNDTLMEPQFVVHPQESGINIALPNGDDRASRFSFYVPGTDPCGRPVRIKPSIKRRTAISTDDFCRQRVLGRHRCARLSLLHPGLDPVEQFLADDGRMAVFNIKLVQFSPVFHRTVRKSDFESFLAESISGVFFIF